VARIALDIDSTLHHYWDLLADLSQRRYGIPLDYDAQTSWAIDDLQHEQLRALVAETHSDENVLAAEPYPEAVETVRAWHEQGHWIHVTSHRSGSAHPATQAWLERIGMPFDDLYCSYDKVTRCVELEIDVLVDDSPVNLTRAREHGIVGATILHPWNADLAGTDGIVAARDWRELRERLEPVLAAPTAARPENA
jgi:FMN phosphatase YigB (HAD superfamily)